MGSAEVKAARRRAELLWQQHTRDAEVREAAQAKGREAQHAKRQDEDAKTARLRALRLAAEQRATEHFWAGRAGERVEVAPSMNPDDLRSALERHRRWLDTGGEERGRAALAGVTLPSESLWRAGLRKACLDRANLNGSNLDHASLYEASLRDARLVRASLWQADLRKADLHNAESS